MITLQSNRSRALCVLGHSMIMDMQTTWQFPVSTKTVYSFHVNSSVGVWVIFKGSDEVVAFSIDPLVCETTSIDKSF